MPRKAKGTTFVSDGSLYASVAIAPKKRLARALPFLDVADESAAREWAGALQEIVDALRAAGGDGDIAKKIDTAVQTGIDDPKGGLARVHEGIALLRAKLAPVTLAAVPKTTKQVTVKTFGEQWTTGKLHEAYPDHVRKKKTSFKDAQILERWVYDPVGHIALDAFRLKDAQEVLRRVPRSLSSSTRRHVAQAMVRVFNLAVYPCQLIAASPIPKGFLPKVHTRPTAYLYPTEDRALLAHKRVPLVNRIFYGFLAREGMRREEALLLTWADLDLVHGSVRLDTNKTNDPRAWALDPSVVKVLAWWKKQQNDPPRTARVFRNIVNPARLATALQEHLELAGVDRPELFEHNEKRRRVNIHALRATFVTLSLANGKSEAWVQDRTGHRSSVMVNRYRRVARTAAELRLGGLAPLHEALPEVRKSARRQRAA